MRARILFPIILMAGILMFLGYWFRPQPAQLAVVPATPAAAESAPVVQAAAVPAGQTWPMPATLPAEPAEMAEAATDDDQTVAGRIVQLETVAMNSDADSLQLILLSLTDTNPQIRAAALEAAIQFNSPEAIPALQATLAKLENSREKDNVQAAIEFLQLQPLTLDAPANSPR